jgi:hypothetical protein
LAPPLGAADGGAEVGAELGAVEGAAAAELAGAAEGACVAAVVAVVRRGDGLAEVALGEGEEDACRRTALTVTGLVVACGALGRWCVTAP